MGHPARTEGVSRRCRLCSTRGQRHESTVKCVSCNVFLCICGERNCFYDFHTVKNLNVTVLHFTECFLWSHTGVCSLLVYP